MSSMHSSTEMEPTITQTSANTTMPVSGTGTVKLPRIDCPFAVMGLQDDEENVAPREIPILSDVDEDCSNDVIRGHIVSGVFHKHLLQFKQAGNLVHRKSYKNATKTIQQLTDEIGELKQKKREEEEKSEELADELGIIKDVFVEKSDNIKDEMEKLVRFCDQFRSMAFLENYNAEKELIQLKHDLETENEITTFLEERIAVEKTKREEYLKFTAERKD